MLWSVDPLDWTTENVDEIVSKVVTEVEEGDIIPTTLEEVVGQQHIIGKDKLLYRAIKADKLSSVIFMVLRELGRPRLPK